MKVKVAHLITRLDLGGAQQNTLYTVRHLDRNHYEPVLICGMGGWFDSEVSSDAFLRTVYISSLVREISFLNDFLAFLELVKVLRDERPDIVHTHSSKAGILGRLAAAWVGVPVIVHTFHGFGFHDGQNSRLKSLYVLIESVCARLTTRLIFVSHSNAKYAQRHGLCRSGPATIIRSGIELSRFPASVDRSALRRSAGIGIHSSLIVSIGNLKPQKNAADLIAIAAQVIEQLPNTHFAFIGDGPQKLALQAKVLAIGLEGKFIFLGWRRDSAQWLAAADAFALTSLWEGLPRALLEAMKTGLPCVCYATDGVTDVLQDEMTGHLVAAGNTNDFARRLIQLLSDQTAAKRLGAAAAAAIGEEFDINRMVRDQERLYTDLLSQRLEHGPSTPSGCIC